MRSRLFKIKGTVFLALLFVTSLYVVAPAQKMSSEEIIAKHLASIGTGDLLANSKNLISSGTSEFISRQPAQKTGGKFTFASNGSDFAFFSTFNASNYQMERIGLFSEKVNIPTVQNGGRSPLGRFLKGYDKMVDNRILGGCIFSSWFLISGIRNGKFEVDGIKKIGDRSAWVLSYTPKGGLSAGSYIKLYFDSENFRHLRTVYREKQPDASFSGADTRNSRSGDWSADMASNGITLTEDFSDVRSDLGLMLPHKYVVNLALDGSSGTQEYQWNFAVENYKLISKFPPNFFSFTNTPS